MFTVVLAGIVVVLMAANAFLYFFSKEESLGEVQESYANGSLDSVAVFGNSSPDNTRVKRELLLLRQKLERNSSRTEYALKKLNNIEKSLSKNGHTVMPKKEVLEKIARLEDFRREANVAIEAMKDHLKEKKPKKEDKEIDEKIRNIVFGAGRR